MTCAKYKPQTTDTMEFTAGEKEYLVPVSVKAVRSALVRKVESLEFLSAESISCQGIKTAIILTLTFYFAL